MNQILDFGNDENKKNKKNEEINKTEVNSGSNIREDVKIANTNNNINSNNSSNSSNNNKEDVIISPKMEHPNNEFENGNLNEDLNESSNYNNGNENINYNNYGSFDNNNMNYRADFNKNYNSDINRINNSDDSYDTMEQFIPNMQNKNKGNTVFFFHNSYLNFFF